MKAWHFVNETLRDGRPVPPDGETLTHDGELVMCSAGYHASKRLIDALGYAPGPTICRVELGGEIIQDSDKMVASKRTILWRVDGEDLLREFARRCALDVIHLWDAPDVVKQYLKTGDELIRSAARSAARDAERSAARSAAWSAERSAARDAARDAARSAARSAERAAAWSAERSAARSAAWSAERSAERDAAWAAAWSAERSAERAAAWSAERSAARDAAWAAERSAERDAAWSAAWDAAWAAARSAAWDAAWAAQGRRLVGMVSHAHRGRKT